MARALLVALAWCAVRSEEYGGGAMPQYGGADYDRGALVDDYRGHSHDAPAPLDYKYEEEPPGDTEKPSKYAEDTNRWRRPEKIKRRPARDDIKEDAELQGNDADADPGLTPKVSRRRTRRRVRGRRDEPRRRAVRRGRTNRDEENLARYLDNNDYRDETSKYIEADDRILPRETTVRLVRRKPRDRKYVPQPVMDKSSEEIVSSEVIADRGIKEDKTDDADYWTGEENEKPPARMRPMLPERDSDVESSTKQRLRVRPTVFNQDYGDYYENLSKLPVTFRRTTTMTTARAMVTMRMRPPPRMWGPGRTRPPGVMRPLWPGRRAGVPWDAADDDADAVESLPSPDSPAAPDPDIPDDTKDSEPSPAPTTSTDALTPTLTSSDYTTVSNTTASNTTIIISTATVAPTITTTLNAVELSLAEKSRQSILRKAKMKEMVKSPGTKKPPVLLHVMNQPPTVVMVEPATTPDPWMRARQVNDDGPHTLEKVKRFMRHKLVAGAKNIRDLTDNWDDTVCDYIDVSLLDAAEAPSPLRPPLGTAVAAVVLHLVINNW